MALTLDTLVSHFAAPAGGPALLGRHYSLLLQCAKITIGNRRELARGLTSARAQNPLPSPSRDDDAVATLAFAKDDFAPSLARSVARSLPFYVRANVRSGGRARLAPSTPLLRASGPVDEEERG